MLSEKDKEYVAEYDAKNTPKAAVEFGAIGAFFGAIGGLGATVLSGALVSPNCNFLLLGGAAVGAAVLGAACYKFERYSQEKREASDALLTPEELEKHKISTMKLAHQRMLEMRERANNDREARISASLAQYPTLSQSMKLPGAGW